MNRKEILQNLCWYDPRNPDNFMRGNLEEEREREELYREGRKGKCFCDNCFYGRDKLANALLNLEDWVTEHYGKVSYR